MTFIYFLRIGDTFIVVAVVVSTIVISIAIAVVLRIVVSGTIVIANTTVAVAGINSAITKTKIFVIKKLMKSAVAANGQMLIVEFRQLLGPSIGNKLGAGREFSFASPSFVYGYQNKACFDIL